MSPTDLKAHALFADLSEEELALLLELLEDRRMRAGETVLQEGSESEGLMLLVSGALKLSNAAEGELGRLEAPAALGAAALVAPGPRGLDARAETDGEVRMLTRTAFHRFAVDAPRGANRLLEAVARELAQLLRQAGEFTG